MREIEFRGMRKDNNEFVFGNYMEKNDPQKEKPTFWCCYIQDKAISMYAVDKITVGQYTGLKDKNGKKIFEGDIVDIQYNYIGKIEVKFEKGKFNISDYNILLCEIVGNIHENKDLLCKK